MKWLTRLFKRDEHAEINKIKDSILDKLGEGKHIIHIMLKDREVTLLFSEEEFNNAIHILEKYKHDKDVKNQKQSFTLFHNYLSDSSKQTT